MNRPLLMITVTLSLAAVVGVCTTFGRGFGGGGGGFHGGGGGFGGGGFGGGRYHGGGGGFGGGGYHGGGGFGGGGYGGGGFGGGYHYGGYGGGGEFHGGGFNNSGIGGEFGGDGIRGAGGLAGDGYRGAGGFDRNLGGDAGGFRAGQFGPAPTASHLDSFLGLPTDMGMHGVSGEHANGYSGSARGLSMNNPYVGGSERGASGHEYTGPNGTTIAHGSVGERGAGVGPNGAAAGARGARGTVIEGPNSNTIAHGSAGERGAAVGPNGAAAGERGASGTVARGANGGTIARGTAGERGVVAGRDGVAGGSKVASGTIARGPNGGVVAHGSEVTRNWSAADMRVQGNYARSNFHDWNAFGHNWYHDHPNAWYAAGFANGIWAAATWSSINGWFGADWPSYGYMYGNDLTYDDDNVLLYGQPIATAAEYYDSAENLAQAGEQANVPNTPPPQNPDQVAAENPSQVQWLPLGVFEAIPAGEKSSNMIFQLAVNKAGIIRGNYYDGADKNVQLIQGSVDKETQRVAWVVADKKNIIFNCGLYNLTKSETPVLVHIDKDKNQQWTLVRMTQKPADANINTKPQ